MAMKVFNERVKTMNSSASRQLVLSAEEARNLHADLFTLLANLAEMNSKPSVEDNPESISFDGGSFK